MAFVGSNSSHSIKKPAGYAEYLIADAETEVLDPNDFPISFFNVDIKKEKDNRNTRKDFRTK